MKILRTRVYPSIRFLLLCCFSLIYLFPFYIMVSISLKTQQEAAESTVGLPPHPMFSNFSTAWREASLGPALLTSVIVSVISVVALCVLGAGAAYVLVRRTNRLTTIVYYSLLLGLVLPFQLGIIPLYALVRSLGLLGSPIGLIVYYIGLMMPFSIFIYATFLRSAPRDLEDAALIDGANHAQILRFIVFPLLAPATSTIAILNFVTIWNDFFVPLLFLSGSDHQTLPIAVYGFVGQYVTNWNLVFAGLLITVAPMLIIFLILQHRIVDGFSSGLKG